MNYIYSLVKITHKLTYNRGNKSKLNGFERLIAEDLKRSKFFENDEYLTPEFKLNLTLILCRIIYKIMESNTNLNSQEQRSKNLNIFNKNKISNIILEEILTGNEIKPEFLKKFYKLSLEEFQKEYDKFEAKMKINKIYKENFRIYLFHLIRVVNKITQWRTKKSKHTKIELAVIADLSNYNFVWDNDQINAQDCFIKNEKKLKEELTKFALLDNKKIKHSVFEPPKQNPLSDKKPYSTLEFINDLLIEMPKIYENLRNSSKMNIMEKLSVEFFKKGKHFLKHILSKIGNKNNPDYNPNYKFSIEILEEAEKNLKKLLKNKATNILKYFKTYRIKNPELKEYNHEQWKTHNPNLKSRFFKQLDTEVKRYWYGFICADGSITSGNDPSRIRYQISIEISKKDRNHLVKFCEIIGLNSEKIGERIKFINGKSHKLVYIIFTCKPMYQDLINLGLKDLKEGSELSMNLENDSLSYSLLLGFYDGDGREGSTRIYSTNFPLLSQIKDSYGLKAKIRKTDIKEIPDDAIKESISRTKPMYDLALGTELLNKMMSSYPDSLKRKRKVFSEKFGALESLKEKMKNRKNLKNLVRIYGKVKLAKRMNVSYKTLDNLCVEWNIEATKLSALERLKSKIKNREELIKLIKTNGKEKTAEFFNTGYRTLDALIEEWGIDAKYLTVKELLKIRIGNKNNLQELLSKYSLTKLAKKYGVARNTLKRLCDEWNIEI